MLNKNALHCRSARFESLENRNLLSVAPIQSADFEDVGAGLAPESHAPVVARTLNDVTIPFESGSVEFQYHHSYDAGWDYESWDGWSYSNETDVTTPGFGNQYSAYLATPDATNEFGIATTGANEVTISTPGAVFQSIDFTNTTYTALSMRDGDGFAKEFGGVTGDDPDWFLLTISGKDSAGTSVGNVEFYLADYRFADNAQDYIVDEWTTIDLTSLGGAVSLEFAFSSSDMGVWGMNTPAFFAADNLTAYDPSVADFENLGDALDAESYGPIVDRTANGVTVPLETGPVAFNYNHYYDAGWDYESWDGWSYSNMTDVTTPGFGNQYSAYLETPDASNTFGIATLGDNAMELSPAFADYPFQSIDITNTTYAALSMRDGDGFAKEFGGTTGDDPDWFLLTITGKDSLDASVGDIEFYLADYRFADNAQDYIVDEWTTVDLTSLDGAVSLEFALSSSDAGVWGMNTPAFFAADNLRLQREPTADAGGPYGTPAGRTVQLDASGTSHPAQDPATLQYLWDLDGDAIFGETGVEAIHGDEIGVNPTFFAGPDESGQVVDIALQVIDDEGFESIDTSIVNVTQALVKIDVAGVVQEGPAIPYAGPQDQSGEPIVSADSLSVQLMGNAWKQILLDYDVTQHTILEFDFSSSVEGEIQGIGFDTDNVLDGRRLFQLSGTQRVGAQDFHDYTTGEGVKHYAIPVGQFFTGSVSRLVLANDHDGTPSNADSTFSNITIRESSPLQIEVAGANQTGAVVGYAGAQDGAGYAAVSSDSLSLQLEGNAWKQVLLNYDITDQTILEFDFTSTVEGEIQGIGFDTDDVLDGQRLFQLSGTQRVGIQAFKDYAQGEGVRHYAIPVGQFFTGSISRLVLANDHDTAPQNADSLFSNIKIRESVALQIEVAGANQSGPVVGYAGAQDAAGYASVSSDSLSVQLEGNAWKQMLLDYTITENTVLEFDFSSNVEGEIQAIGFDTDDQLGGGVIFQLSGTQPVGRQDFNDYTTGQGAKRYSIRVGDFMTGDISRLTFINDHDTLPSNADGLFANIRIYEDLV